MTLNTLLITSLALVVLGLFIIQRGISFFVLKDRSVISGTLIFVPLVILSSIAYSGLPGWTLLILDISLVLALDMVRRGTWVSVATLALFSLVAIASHIVLVCDIERENAVTHFMAFLAPSVRVGIYLFHVIFNALMIKDMYGAFALMDRDFMPSSWQRLCSALLCVLLSVLAFCPGTLCVVTSSVLLVIVTCLDVWDRYLEQKQIEENEEVDLDPNIKQEARYDQMLVLFREDKIYLEPDFSLRMLAERMGTNQSYVSNMLNNYIGMSFPKLRNALRIEYAKYYIDQNPSVKVEELQFICGYGTLVTFEREFKKRVGQVPSDYIKGMKTMRALGHSPSPSRSEELEQLCGLPPSLRDE